LDPEADGSGFNYQERQAIKAAKEAHPFMTAEELCEILPKRFGFDYDVYYSDVGNCLFD
jgi:hypothetical protein